MSEDAIAQIYHFLQLSDRIATAGQPTEAQFAAIQAAGYEWVVNLALSDSPNALPDEAAIVAHHQMQYVHIPVDWLNPTLADIQQFFRVMQAHPATPVFVHCAANMRVSAFMYLYRRICEGTEAAIAQADLHRIWVPNERWQSFIEQVLQHYAAL